MNSSAVSLSEREDCISLGWNSTILWDNPYGLISWETHILIETIKGVVLIPILYLIGAPANVINMAVFFKQGLNERINLCLFLLALVDLLYQTFLLIYRATFMPEPFTSSKKYGVISEYMINNNVLGLYGMSYVSMLISAVIATERCVCVLFPLKAQGCLRTKPFAFTLIISMCVVGFLRFVVTAKYHITCFYEVRTERTYLESIASEFYVHNKEMLDVLDGIFYGFCISLGCPLVVVIATVITAIKLRQVINWREKSSYTMSSKEIGVTKMLIYLSCEFLMLSIPLLIVRILPMFGTQLSYGGHYANTFWTLVSLAELCSFTSSSVNFFVYYFTGSRFRETLQQMLHWKCVPNQASRTPTATVSDQTS